MTSFEIYNLFLCIFVFIAFTAVFGGLVGMVVKLSLRAIRAGLEDERLKSEYEKAGKVKKSGAADRIFSTLLCLVVLAVFLCSVTVGLMPDQVSGKIPTVRVVNSGSMAKKYPSNTYLFANDLNDQIETFDLILTYQLPPEDELERYDVVVYETDGIQIIHRIVEIEEPNQDHPGERYFLLQGDAVASPDRFPVKYEQMKAIYRGERVPFVGSFVAFMQSPAGWLCILLILFVMIMLPILERKFEKEKVCRLVLIGVLGLDGKPIETKESAESKRDV